MSLEEQSELCGLFGPISQPDHPIISNVVPDGILADLELRFHHDIAYTPVPYLGGALHAVDVADGCQRHPLLQRLRCLRASAGGVAPAAGRSQRDPGASAGARSAHAPHRPPSRRSRRRASGGLVPPGVGPPLSVHRRGHDRSDPRPARRRERRAAGAALRLSLLGGQRLRARLGRGRRGGLGQPRAVAHGRRELASPGNRTLQRGQHRHAQLLRAGALGRHGPQGAADQPGWGWLVCAAGPPRRRDERGAASRTATGPGPWWRGPLPAPGWRSPTRSEPGASAW